MNENHEPSDFEEGYHWPPFLTKRILLDVINIGIYMLIRLRDLVDDFPEGNPLPYNADPPPMPEDEEEIKVEDDVGDISMGN